MTDNIDYSVVNKYTLKVNRMMKDVIDTLLPCLAKERINLTSDQRTVCKDPELYTRLVDKQITDIRNDAEKQLNAKEINLNTWAVIHIAITETIMTLYDFRTAVSMYMEI